MAHTLNSDLEMLRSALAALEKGKIHVVRDHLERVIENMSQHRRYYYPSDEVEHG